MTKEFFESVLVNTLESVQQTLGVKAMEYVRNNNAMHNFDVGARITGRSREQVLYGFALKHHISIQDMRDDIEVGIIPTKEKVDEKYNDAINYLILEKASVLERIELSNEPL